MIKNNRVNYLDYAKAIAVFFVIAIHVGFYQLNDIILFAMPLFFIITGYNFTPKKRTLKEDILIRFKSIMVPFWIAMLFYAIIEVIRAYIFGYGTYEIIFSSLAKLIYGSGIIPFQTNVTEYLKGIMSYKTQPVVGVDVILPSNCHLWFLPATFIGFVMFAIIIKGCEKKHWIKGLCIIGLLLLSSLEVIFPCVMQLPFGIGRGAIGATFMIVGYYLKEYKVFENKSVIFNIGICLITSVVFILALCLGSDGSSMVRSVYGPYGLVSVFITFIGGSCGAILFIELCRVVEKIPVDSLKKFLSFSGKNAIVFYIAHMFVKFLLDVFYISILNQGNAGLLDAYKMGLLAENSLLFMLIEVVLIIVICAFIAKLRTLRTQSSITKIK